MVQPYVYRRECWWNVNVLVVWFWDGWGSSSSGYSALGPVRWRAIRDQFRMKNGLPVQRRVLINIYQTMLSFEAVVFD